MFNNNAFQNPKIYFTYLVFFTIIVSCSDKIIKPLKDGKPYYGKSRPKVNPLTMGPSMYLWPGKNIKVRAVEDCEVVSVIKLDDSVSAIIARGKLFATYSNLEKCFVSKGAHVKKASIIGELSGKGESGDNYLDMALYKTGGESLRVKW